MQLVGASHVWHLWDPHSHTDVVSIFTILYRVCFNNKQITAVIIYTLCAHEQASML